MWQRHFALQKCQSKNGDDAARSAPSPFAKFRLASLGLSGIRSVAVGSFRCSFCLSSRHRIDYFFLSSGGGRCSVRFGSRSGISTVSSSFCGCCGLFSCRIFPFRFRSILLLFLFSRLLRLDIATRLLGTTLGLRTTVALGEFVDPASGIDKTLLTSEERVAGAANTNAQILDGGTSLIYGATGALDHGFLVFWMNFSLHKTNGKLRE